MSDVVSRYIQLLSHEFNNTLTVLYGQSSLLKTQAGQASPAIGKIATSAALLEQNSHRLVELVRELREAFRAPIDEPTQVVALSQLLTQSVAFLRLHLAQGAGLNLDAPPDQVLVAVKPVRARGVVWKLIARALGRAGDEAVRVGWAARETETCLRVFDRGAAASVVNEALLLDCHQTLAESGAGLRAFRDGERHGVELHFPRVD